MWYDNYSSFSGGTLHEESVVNLSPRTINFSSVGLINLTNGKIDNNGFYVGVSGNTGILKVKLMNQLNYTYLPFFNDWSPFMVSEVAVFTGNTATGVYWGN